MSPSPPLRKSGKDAPFEAGLLTHGLNTDLLSAPSHPCGTVAFRRGFRCRLQLRGQWRFYTALPAHLWRIVVIKDRDAKERSALLQSSPVKQSEFQQVELIYEAGIDGMGRGGELDSKNTNALDLLCRRSRAS